MTTPPVTDPRPADTDPVLFDEHPVVVGAAGIRLDGLLSMPNLASVGSKVPGVVLVQGSGPSDRNETIGPNKPFRDLSSGLARQGIAVLRYDKRSFAHPEWFKDRMAEITLDDEVVDDALSALQELRLFPAIDSQRIFVLGHSLGAQLAPAIARRDAHVTGTLLLAAPTGRLDDILRRQVRFVAAHSADLSAAQRTDLQNLESRINHLQQLIDTGDPGGALPYGMPLKYTQDWIRRDVIRDLLALGRPALVLQGTQDYQVTLSDDFFRFQSVESPGLTLKRYDGLNHLFIRSDVSGPDAYAVPGHVDRVVIDDIARWIHSVAPRM